MTTINTEPLLQAISEQAPGGTDIRDSETYEALSSEIEKMASPTSDGQIDWTKIETLASRILAEQSKDFMVAAWLSAAWIHHHGIDGLAAGLHLYEQLVAQFWDSAQPPLKRLRGRRNALIWGIERASSWLEQQDLAPLPVAFHAAMLADIQSLDARLAELDPDSPPLQALMQQIRRLPTEEPDPVDAPEAVSPAETDRHGASQSFPIHNGTRQPSNPCCDSHTRGGHWCRPCEATPPPVFHQQPMAPSPWIVPMPPSRPCVATCIGIHCSD
ncbi:type VI secretion system ImpA family N-terminal domain-containing protein [Castellaniella sp.]|uniref:type VI secretion system ImpA family N-terminal domain-containing protein n=1 Tax=Castellaniella sp. TaxID=1955812 RepID=UPI002B0006FF|nr:type VI secretion system ImpA family N-terminal domain-containing protein [Castellaniella sp.]